MATPIDNATLAKVKGMDVQAASSISAVFPTVEALASAEVQDLLDIVDGLTETAAGAAVKWAKIMARAFASVAQPQVQGTHQDGFVEAIKSMGKSLGDALTMSDREVCQNCGAVMPKDFHGSTCIKCGMPVRSAVTCLRCNTENPGAADGSFCQNCGTELVAGERRRLVIYLMRQGGFPTQPLATTEYRRLTTAGNEAELKRVKAQAERWQEEGANQASPFRR